MSRPLISIIIPVFNEEKNVWPAYHRVTATMASLAERVDYEILFTDNHSLDGTFAELEALAEHDPKVRVLRFSRNYGFQRSILTGYLNARGAAAVQLDCDLQDPPELISEFLDKWEKGYKVVYGVRRYRPESWWLSSARRAYYAMLDNLSHYPLPRNAGDFRLVDRSILNALAKVDDQQPYLRGLIAGFGFEQTGVPYDRSARESGESKFPLSQLFALGLDGVLSHSIVPLRIATYIGLLCSLASVVGMLVYLVGKLFFGQAWPAGFATLTLLLLLTLGLNSLFLGILGEYIGRIFHQVKKAPLTLIEVELNAPEPSR